MTSKTLCVPPCAPNAAPVTTGRLRFALVAPVALVATLLTGSAPDFGGFDSPAPQAVGAPSSLAPGGDGKPGGAQRPANPSKEIEALARVVANKYRISHKATREYVRAAFREGARIDVDPLLIVAVMAVESGFDPAAESTAGALGLMQVIPRYHADKFEAAGGKSVLDPATNIQVGARVLKDYIARHGDPVAGLQRYNGSSADPSSAYARKVLGEKQWLQQAIRHAQAGVGVGA